jgi:hypothetical protein
MARTKRCSACERRRPLSAFGRDGQDVWCRLCRRAYQRRWMAEHRDAYNARHRAYYRANREALREYYRKYQRRRRALMQAGLWKGGRRAARASGR